MKRNLYYLTILSLLMAGCSTGTKETGKENNTSQDTLTALPAGTEQIVETLVLEKQKISRTIEYTSSLIPFEENHLVPSTPGRIEKIYVEIGSRVRKGDLLVQMDRTQLHQAEIQLKNVENDFRRLDTLNKVGSISEQQYEQMKAQYDIALSNVEFLRENTVLRAPFAGVISGKYYEDGEFYSGAPTTLTGKAAIVSLGMDAAVTCDIYPGKTFPGKVMMVHPTIDPATRSFTTEIKISNDRELLRPGMFSRVTMDLGEEMALVLPSVSVMKLQGSNERYVFVEENGLARRIIVQIGKRFDDKIEVVSDELSVGSHLIVKGQARLIDGDRVKVVYE
jgi:membrane fusion protein (multidrug efflux system)